MLEPVQNLPDGGAAHGELLGQLTLGRQPPVLAQLASGDELLDVLLDRVADSPGILGLRKGISLGLADTHTATIDGYPGKPADGTSRVLDHRTRPCMFSSPLTIFAGEGCGHAGPGCRIRPGSPAGRPGMRRGPLNRKTGATRFEICPAASYSPTRSPAQYHRR